MAGQSDTSWMLERIRPLWRRVCLGLAVAVIAGLVSTLDPLLMRHLIDRSLPERELCDSLGTVVLIALCFIGRSGLGGLGGLLSYRVAQLLAQDLRVELLRHMTTLSADWHERTLLGEKLSRIEQDVEQIAQFGADVANSVVRSGVFFILNLAIMFSLNWQMTLSVLPLFPLFHWVRAQFRLKTQLRADRTQAEIGRAAGNLAEHLGAIPQIQILGAEDIRMARTVDAWTGVLGAQWAQRRTEIAFSVSITSVLALAILLVLGLGAREYLNGTLSLGGLVAFYAYVTRIFEPVSTAMELYSRAQRMLASARRVRDVIHTQTSVPDIGQLTSVPSPLLWGLLCNDVSFSYRSGRPVLRNISLRIGGRERVALIGRSGSGKSTLARLLTRMEDPSSGQVVLERISAADYTLRALRKTICYVPQHAVLFSGTIRDNLLHANGNASDDEVNGAIEVAQLLPIIRRLPHGLDTVLGPDAVGLSGGERQRLAVARALLRHSAILVLDEATSALDAPTEQAVLTSIAFSRPDTALVIISHHLQALTWMDRIILLDSGMIAAQGTHTALYDSSALYRSLYTKNEEPEDRLSPVQEHLEQPISDTAIST
jgi:ABC-type bacteriocin/lantibiotic exporter with double-glycine peptidase domain